ncbi:MAG TPA: hypothetical protein VFH50_10590 [Acidimicrobiales bacterium]|nr:hypothetical protein [Acidimicrobiales bacterium]
MAALRDDKKEGGRDQGVPQLVGELWELVVAYLKQETIEPLKGIGKFLALGIPGAVLSALGLAVLLLAVLRVLQTRTGSTFTGNLTALPYVITAATAIAVAALAGVAIVSGSSRKARR